jgi:TolB-like protein/Flp pilus assembly protein TadD
MANPRYLDGDATSEDIRAQLQRIVAFPQFAKSPRLRAFLEHVVSESLAGRASRIKAFTVGLAVFDGDENFDPQTNTIVRVEAGRLRRLLSQYYLTAGQDDAIVIDMPKGGYAPLFRRNETATSGTDPEVTEGRLSAIRVPARRRSMAFGAGALIAILALTGWWFFGQDRSLGIPKGTPAIDQIAVPSGNALVAVLPFAAVSDDVIEGQLSNSITEAIITELSKLSGVSVMAHASMLELESRPTSIRTFRAEFGVTHVLRGNLQREGSSIRVRSQLIDTATAETIWADSLNGVVGSVLELEDKLARQIIGALSIQIMPDEQDRFLNRFSTDREALLLFQQALTLIMAPNESTRISTARQLFQRVGEIDPNFAGGLSGQSMSYSLEVIFLQSVDPRKDLELAVTLAKKAIEVDDDFGMGYASLGFASTLSGNFEEGLSNGKRAIAVQPSDSYSRWMYGVALVLSGDTGRAIEQLTEALRLDPAKPRVPYLNLLGIAHYVAGNYAAAIDVLERNLERGGPTGPHMDLFRAGGYAELGQEDDARAVIDAMRLSYPEFPYEAWLSRWLDSDRLHEMLNNLYSAGLPKP